MSYMQSAFMWTDLSNPGLGKESSLLHRQGLGGTGS